MSKVVRSVKNVTKGYSHVQVKVRNGKNKHYSKTCTVIDVEQQQQATTRGALQALI